MTDVRRPAEGVLANIVSLAMEKRDARRSGLLTAMAVAICLLIPVTYVDAAQESVFATGFGFATGIAVDAGGDVYVADYYEDQIRKFDSAGNLIATWGTSGSADGQLTQPYGLALNRTTGDVYVADWNRIQQFTSSGAFVRKWGSYESGVCTGSSIQGNGGIAVDGFGFVYVANETGCIEKFSATGEPLLHWGSNGTGQGEFAGAHGIAVDESGFIYVADLSHRVQKFMPDGEFIMQWGNDSNTTAMPDLALASSGDLYVGFNSGNGAHAIEKRSTDGGLLGSYQVPATGGNTTVAVGPDGRLFVSDGTRVMVVDPGEPAASLADSVVGSFALTGAPVTLSASKSIVPFSLPVNYTWDLGLGSFSLDSGATDQISTTFATAGVKTVAVRVAAASGRIATASRQIDVRLAPPAGRVGVTINDGDFATNSPRVSVSPIWFPGTTSTLVSNDGGFGSKGSTAERALSSSISWRIPTGGSERLPKTVYSRFLGIAQDTATFTDDIILDTTTPQIEEASEYSQGSASRTARISQKRLYRVRLAARAKISGIAAVAFSARRGGGKLVRLSNPRKRGIVELKRTFKVRAKAAPRFARVQNAAGTWSRWTVIR